MSNDKKHRYRGQRGALVGALLLLATGCHDDVENLTAPDRQRATNNPSDVEAFIGGAFFPTFHNAVGNATAPNTGLVVNLFAFGSAEFVATLAGSQDQQQYEDLVEPRRVHNNSAHISQSVGPHGPRNYWATMGRASSITYDGLQILNEGMRLTDNGVDVTERARAFAKFMQGWAWGYQALIFDKIHVVPESVVLPQEAGPLQKVILESLVPYDQGIKAAVASLDEAIAIAKANPNVVRYPSLADSPLWFGTPTAVTNDQFIRMANTLAARLLVLGARTPAERAAVDWNKVLQYTAAGVTQDFSMQLNTQRTSTLLSRIQANTSGGTSNGRWNYRAIGPADQSGAYQKWIKGAVSTRDRFDIVTPDRRITGPNGPQTDGSYTRYRSDNNGFLRERGTYLFSAYQWSRHAIRNNFTGTNTGFNAGVHPLITVDENNLLRAEAMLRTGDRAGAATLINVTRTRPQRIGNTTYQNLPPVTTAGVPLVNGECVPRTDAGACGDLLTALRYERMIELAGTDAIRGYADSRGFGLLVDGALLSYPVPGNVLELYGLDEYTFGGIGTLGTATYAPATLP